MPTLRREITFAEAAEEYLRFAEEDRGCEPSTIRGYRSQLNAHLLPAFGSMRIEEVTEREIERWRAGLAGTRKGGETLSNKTKNHQLVSAARHLPQSGELYDVPRNPLATEIATAFGVAATLRCSRPRRSGA